MLDAHDDSRPQSEQGLYSKYEVRRTDGRDLPGGDRQDAEYFVLDLTNDPHAPAAISAYIASLRDTGKYGQLADDLDARYLSDGGPEAAPDTGGNGE